MTTSNVRITGDTSGLTSSLERVGDVIEREREKIDEFSDSIRNIPNVNGNNPFSNNDVANVMNNQASQTQVIRQQTGNSGGTVVNGGGGGNGSVQSGGHGNAVSALTRGSAGGALTSALTAMGPVGLAIAAVIGGGKVANNVEKKWEDKLPEMLDTYNSLSDVGGRSAEQNSENIRDMFDATRRQRNEDNTRFKTDDYLATMRQMKEFGFSDWSDSLTAASNVMRFENAGMGSRAQLMEVEGISKRFGLEGALDQAFAGLKASGMEKGQFDEFLSSMEGILEDGISKGFVKGADEIATDLTLLESLSGGSKLWQGQYGAANLQQMNSAVENATSLGSVNDVIMYQAINSMSEEDKSRILGDNYDKENGYINNMMILERGLTADTIGPIFEALKATGGSKEDQIARFMSTFGLNYTKAMDVYNMAQNYKPGDAEKIANDIRSYRTDTSAESVDSQLLEARENIANQTQRIGADVLEINKTLTQMAANAIVDDEIPETKEIKMLPVSGDEVGVWEKLIKSYNGPMSQEQLYQEINNYFNDPTKREWADVLNFQNNDILRNAWETGNGTEFFTSLFDNMVSTAFGPMSMSDWRQIEKDKELKKFRKTDDNERIEIMRDYEKEKDISFETLAVQNGMYEALKELANYARTREREGKTGH